MITPEEAVKMLVEGNLRFTNGRPDHPRRSPEHRLAVSREQHPFAAVLGCADSRVPPEVIFDQGLGDLFVVRSAGHVIDDAILGSLEYAAAVLKVPLILVLGHSSCGAVQAAMEPDGLPGTLKKITSAIRPAMDRAMDMSGDTVENVASEHAKITAEQLRFQGSLLPQHVINGDLKIACALYDLNTGRVKFLD